MKSWYSNPAKEWLEALPIGNGHIGAMVFGGTNQERIQLNEDTLWAGGPIDRNNPEALKYLPEIRKLLFAGNHIQAEKLALKYLIGVPPRLRPYQPLGDLWFEFDGHKKVTSYRRELDLETGTVSVAYDIKGVRFVREVFTSAPDQILVVSMEADKPGMFSLRIGINSKLPACGGILGPDGLILRGQIADLPGDRVGEGGYGLKFEARAKVILKNGNFLGKGDKDWEADGRVYVAGADSVVLILAASTDFYGENPQEVCQRRLNDATKKSVTVLRKLAQADHARLFNRVELDLGGDKKDLVPTDERQEQVKEGITDPGLAALYFQFGRHILISCSRPGTLPANLQGIWNESLTPPWNSNYTTNINFQMNYWLAEVTNLAECHKPLFDLVERLKETGHQTAKKTYNCRGWVLHHNSDPWASSVPFNGKEGIWPVGGAWVAMHLWEHYAYVKDRDFLREKAYPVMKKASEFLLDFLVEDDKGELVTNPSVSPENPFKAADGKSAWLCVGATMDFEIIHDLFTHCIEAGEILGIDGEFRSTLQKTLGKLPPLKIGKHGQLQEWLEDYDEIEIGHRHISHLYACFPGNQITLRGTPRLAEAVRIALERRLGHRPSPAGSKRWGKHAGWSNVWTALVWARLEEAEKAYECIQSQLNRWSFSNLFGNAHSVFQIDATLGITAAIAEMLLQSHTDEINLLPALPKAWPTGEVKGLCARGGYEVGIQWRQGALKTATVRSKFQGTCRVRFRGQGNILINNGQVKCRKIDENVIEFPAEVSTSYKLELR